MPELVFISVLASLGCLLLAVVLAVLVRMAARMGRIERLLAGDIGRGNAELELRTEAGGGAEVRRREFEEFLAEDEARRDLPKKEQFAAYRVWRRDQGLTWGSGGSPNDDQ